jgi:hypothetical protein
MGVRADIVVMFGSVLSAAKVDTHQGMSPQPAGKPASIPLIHGVMSET